MMSRPRKVLVSQIALACYCSELGSLTRKKINTSNLSTKGSSIEYMFTFLGSCSRFHGKAKRIKLFFDKIKTL
jgi:hypothetical protein